MWGTEKCLTTHKFILISTKNITVQKQFYWDTENCWEFWFFPIFSENNLKFGTLTYLPTTLL